MIVIQLATLIAAGTLLEYADNYTKFVSIVWILGFSHYFLGFIYSRHQISSVFTNSSVYLPLSILSGAGVLLYWQEFSLVYYFGLHHALNEAYIGFRFHSESIKASQKSRIQALSFTLHMLGFLMLIHTGKLQTNESLFFLLLFAYVALLIMFLYELFRDSGKNLLPRSIDYLPECIVLVLILIDRWHFNVPFYLIVAYHFIFWAFYPAAMQILKRQYKSVLIYIFLTVGSLVVLVWVFPLDKVSSLSWRIQVGYDQYYFWFVLLSYVHITLSFAISKANPKWLNNIFAAPK